MNKLYNMDCLEFLRYSNTNWDCGIADIPDNLGLDYDEYKDKRADYYDWIELLLRCALPRFKVFWLSFYHSHILEISNRLHYVNRVCPRDLRCYAWRFKFGQYRETDSPNGWRPFYRISSPIWKPNMTDRVPSVRELMKDIRATGDGRVEDDVFEDQIFNDCRVQGNNKERREWHPTQIPENIYRRIGNLSCTEGGTVVDLFAGTGTIFRAIKNRELIGVELSKGYCLHMAAEHSLRVETLVS